jgi:Ca2+-binding RTX toxin-like protein
MSRRSRLTITSMGVGTLVLVLGATVSIAQPFFGTSGDDVITGTNRHDYIAGRNGNDTLNGLARADYIRGGRGNDTVNAGAGADLVLGGPGDDTLSGDEGPDRIFAQQGVDTEYGGPGNDDLWALARVDVTGAPNEPADTLNGGPGNDVFHVRDGEADTVDCGAGNDVVLADFKDQVAPNCEVVKRHVPNAHAKPDDRERHGKGKRNRDKNE